MSDNGGFNIKYDEETLGKTIRWDYNFYSEINRLFKTLFVLLY